MPTLIAAPRVSWEMGTRPPSGGWGYSEREYPEWEVFRVEVYCSKGWATRRPGAAPILPVSLTGLFPSAHAMSPDGIMVSKASPHSGKGLDEESFRHAARGRPRPAGLDGRPGATARKSGKPEQQPIHRPQCQPHRRRGDRSMAGFVSPLPRAEAARACHFTAASPTGPPH